MHDLQEEIATTTALRRMRYRVPGMARLDIDLVAPPVAAGRRLPREEALADAAPLVVSNGWLPAAMSALSSSRRAPERAA